MYDHARRYRMLSLKTKPFPRSKSASEHGQILEARLARDVDRAERVLGDHILKGAEMTNLQPAPAVAKRRARSQK
jgi:DNA-binding GntR family transcriptional regulator